ncbi:MAG: LUD domain-containing protein [Alphaproteobacteria bacterium]|nr:LUD domain-containing protein [Alphaproteobacteria bacterium]
MTEARAAILGRLRERLGRPAAPPERLRAMRAEVDGRLADPPVHPLPARGRVAGEATVALFLRMAAEAKAETARIASAAELPEQVAPLVRENRGNEGLLATADPLLDGLPWEEAGIALRHGRADEGTRASIAVAAAGIAETGSLLLVATPESPMSVHLLADLHVVLLPVSRLFGTMEEALAALRREVPGLPSAAMFVTGPSRTADIEQQMQLGAHGPKQLRIYVSEGE